MKNLSDLHYSGHLWLYFLAPLSAIYRGIIAIRKTLYKRGFFKVSKYSVPVIIVGNITLGGTGKTPLVIYLAKMLKEKGFNPGIVSRGYGGHSKRYPLLVDSNSDPKESGDEPILMATCSHCPVVVDPIRGRAVQRLLENFSCDVVLSDDGLQHYALGRDIEIAVVDGKRRFGNGFCLPAGPLREPLKRLKEVDFVIANGKAQKNEIQMQLVPEGLVNIKTGESGAITSLKNKTIHAIAGIGNPARFFDTLRNEGSEIIEHIYPDHHSFSTADLQFDDNYPIVMTEKDAVKCRSFASSKCWYLHVVAKLPESFKDVFLKRLI